MTGKMKNYSIEFLRTFLAISIVYFHVLHTNIKKFVDWNLYSGLYDNCAGATMIVEGFIIIAGFFMFYSINKTQNLWQFFKNKFVRLYPVFAVSVLCCFLAGKADGYFLFHNLIFCSSIGFNPKVAGITWFITPFFWGMILYFFLVKNISKKFLNFTIIMITYFSYVLLATKGFGRNNVCAFISLSMVRMLASLGLGYLLAVFYEQIKDCKFLNDKQYKTISFFIFSIAEISTLYCIIKWTLFCKPEYNNFIFVPVFLILIFSFICRKGCISLITNNAIFKYSGQYSYSIYVMQQFSFYISGYTFWKNTQFLNNHIFLTLLISVLISCAAGIAAYYLIERPVINFYKSSQKLTEQTKICN